VPANPTATLVPERIRRPVGDSAALSRRSLPLAVLASVVATMLASAYGTDRVGTLLSAATGPVLTALFTTRGRMGVRSAGIAVVTCVAVTLTVSGFTVPELILGGKALIANRHGTFLPTVGGDTASTSRPAGFASPISSPRAESTPAFEASAARLTCDDTAVGDTGSCPSLAIRSTGTADIRITGIDIEGDSAGDFHQTADCPDRLRPNARCSISVEFCPADAGTRQATLVIHQNLPGPPTRIAIQGIGQRQDPPPTPEVSQTG
jgi:hypothetical protein